MRAFDSIWISSLFLTRRRKVGVTPLLSPSSLSSQSTSFTLYFFLSFLSFLSPLSSSLRDQEDCITLLVHYQLSCRAPYTDVVAAPPTLAYIHLVLCCKPQISQPSSSDKSTATVCLRSVENNCFFFNFFYWNLSWDLLFQNNWSYEIEWVDSVLFF